MPLSNDQDYLTHTDPVVSKRRGLSMQVCVLADWTDEQALTFAEKENPCGTEHGWHMRKEGDESLAGAKERTPCKDREGFIHIAYDA